MVSSYSSSFNSEQFKIAQRQNWDSVAPGWEEWWKTLEVAGQKVSDRLLELAEIKPCQKPLYIATGNTFPTKQGIPLDKMHWN